MGKIIKVDANRESWLREIGQELTPHVEKVVKDVTGNKTKMPKWVATVGFPSRGALSTKKRVIGQCWHGMMSKNGIIQIFISPVIHEPIQVGATMAHELVHAILPSDVGHGKPFPAIAKGLGLEGKPTATTAGEGFIKLLEPIIKEAPKFPHSPLVPNPKFKPQTTRLLKASCPSCGYTVRVTKKWVVEAGTPICPTDAVPMETAEVLSEA